MKATRAVLISICVIFVAQIFAGCAATTFNVPMTEPAEVNLKGINKIAIGEIKGTGGTELRRERIQYIWRKTPRRYHGKGGTDLSEEIAQALFESGRFEVLDREHLDRILQEHKLSISDIVDQSTAAQLGKFIGAAALVFGRVSVYKYDEKLTHSDREDEEGKTHRTYTRKGTAHVTVTLQVVDVETGKILAIKKFNSDKLVKSGPWWEPLVAIFKKGRINTTETKTSTDKLPESIDPDPLFANARRLIVQRFMKMIAPHQEMVKVTLLKSKTTPTLEKGISFAKRGYWDEAVKVFEEASKTKPRDSKVWFNLGVAYQFLGEFGQAESFLKKAYDIEPKEKYMDELERCRKRALKRRRFEKQELPTP